MLAVLLSERGGAVARVVGRSLGTSLGEQLVDETATARGRGSAGELVLQPCQTSAPVLDHQSAEVGVSDRACARKEAELLP